jgi:hypothetical protein
MQSASLWASFIHVSSCIAAALQPSFTSVFTPAGPEAGFMLLDSGGRGVWSSNGVAVTSIQRVTGAKTCPQGYFWYVHFMPAMGSLLQVVLRPPLEVC